MGDFLKLVAFGATAAAAIVVAKEVIERTERGEDCSPLAVVKGIGRKIGDFCGNGSDRDEDFDDFDDFDDFEEFELSDDDESLDFDTADMESNKLDNDGFVQLEIEIEDAPETPAAPEAEPEATAETDTEVAVEEALKNAAGFDEDDEEADDEETDE